jgi:hypothetical protein
VKKEIAMTRSMLTALALAAAVLVLPARARAQETPKPEATKPAEAPRADGGSERRGPGVTLRVQLVISRFQGEKKLASLPYTLVVTTGDARARMRMGLDTPIPVTSTAEGGKQTTSIQYRTVGTNIDCTASDRRDGVYQLNIGVENSSALPGAAGNVEGAAPIFRRFETNIVSLLRDGQTIQTIASTDPVTGEVVKIDVTMNVVR